MKEVPWTATRLNKGQFMSHENGDVVLTVEHVDRVIDPYLAGVIMKGRIIYSGLHNTLPDARSTCTRKAEKAA